MTPNKALLGTRHKWRGSRALTFIWLKERQQGIVLLGKMSVQ